MWGGERASELPRAGAGFWVWELVIEAQACFNFIGNLVETVYFPGKRPHRTLSKGMGLDPLFKQTEGQLRGGIREKMLPSAENGNQPESTSTPTMVHLGETEARMNLEGTGPGCTVVGTE